MQKAFRKYHRTLALIMALPLLLTITTGTLEIIVLEWFGSWGRFNEVIMALHTGRIFHLGKIYSVLTGLGALGLLVTGMSMTGLFNPKPKGGTDGI